MESPLQRKLSLDDLTQPEFERIVQTILTVVDPAWLLSKIPGVGPMAELVVKPAQEMVKNAFADREKDRMQKHLETSASIVSAIQQANYNTFQYILRSINFDSLQTLLLIERTRETKSFWREIEAKNKDQQAVINAVSELQRVGLVTTAYGFKHADGLYRDYPDLNVALDYADRRYNQMDDLVERRLEKIRQTIVEMQVPPHLLAQVQRAAPAEKPYKPHLRFSLDMLLGTPQTTLAGFYFLQLFAIEADAQRSASHQGSNERL